MARATGGETSTSTAATSRRATSTNSTSPATRDSGQATGVLVEDCTFKGGGVDQKGTVWGYGICLEWPFDVTIRNNRFYRCSEAAIFSANFGQSYDTRWRSPATPSTSTPPNEASPPTRHGRTDRAPTT